MSLNYAYLGQSSQVWLSSLKLNDTLGGSRLRFVATWLRLCHHQGMRSRFHSATLPSEVADYADEIRLAFLDLGRALTTDSLTGECSPVLDVFENEEWIEIVVDLPGVDASAIRVTTKGDTVLIVGEKARRRPHAESSFHLVERDFGRFARVIRVQRACNVAEARARLADGELRVSLPKIADRRGRAIPISIT